MRLAHTRLWILDEFEFKSSFIRPTYKSFWKSYMEINVISYFLHFQVSTSCLTPLNPFIFFFPKYIGPGGSKIREYLMIILCLSATYNCQVLRIINCVFNQRCNIHSCTQEITAWLYQGDCYFLNTSVLTCGKNDFL